MSDLITVIDALVTSYNQLLVSTQQPPLNDGAILFGREFVDTNRAANSIVIVPGTGTYGPPKAISQAQFAVTPPHANRTKARPLWTEENDLEVHVWGAAMPSSLRDDVRVVQQLASLVMVACFQFATISIRPGRFSWESQRPDAPARSALGQYLVFSLTVVASVTDLSLNFVPPGTKVSHTETLNISP